MKVETYEIEGYSSEANEMATDSQACELIQKLGLAGQSSLVNPETETRNPYRLITNEERAVFQTLFPQATPIEWYQDGIIPLRILQIVEKARECGQFFSLIVWHPEAGQRDPVLVGVKKVKRTSGTYEWEQSVEFLLARWGDALEPFDALKEKARKKLTTKFRSALVDAKVKIESDTQRLEAIVDDMLGGGQWRTTPTYSFGQF